MLFDKIMATVVYEIVMPLVASPSESSDRRKRTMLWTVVLDVSVASLTDNRGHTLKKTMSFTMITYIYNST